MGRPLRSESKPARAPRRGQRSLALLAAAGCFAYFRLIDYDPSAGVRGADGGVEEFFFAPQFSSPILILGLAAWLVYRRRTPLLRTMLLPLAPLAGLIGALLLFAAAATSVWANYVDVLGLMIPSLSLMIVGVSLFLGGWKGGVAMLVPAFFLLLAAPHPAVAVNAVIWPMQLMTAISTAWLLDLAGFEVLQFGDMLWVDREKLFQVIESCAGLGAMETLVMSAVVYNEIFSRTGRRALLLVLAAPGIGLAVNQLRVLSIVLNPYASVSEVHTYQGIAMLVLGVFALAAIDEVVGRVFPKNYRPAWLKPPRRDASGKDELPVGRLWLCVAIFAALGVSTALLRPWVEARPRQIPISSVSPTLGGEWSTKGLPLDYQFLGSVGSSEWVHRLYSRDGREVEVFVAADRRLDPRMSLVSPKNARPGPGFEVAGHSTRRIASVDREVERWLFSGPRGPVLALQWYEGVGSFPAELVRSALALDRGPWRRSGRAMAVRVSAKLSPDPADLPEQEALLEEVATYLFQELRRIEP